MAETLTLSLLPDRLAVCRLPAKSQLPAGALDAPFAAATRTRDELSLVIDAGRITAGAKVESPWRGIQVEGPLDFALTGILAGLSAVLAEAGISIFALSTYDTDYVLVRERDLPAAVQALQAAGYRFLPDGAV